MPAGRGRGTQPALFRREHSHVMGQLLELIHRQNHAQGRDYGRGCLGWVGRGSPGNEAERPSWFPRRISSLKAGLPAGAVSWQLQLRVLYGLRPASAGLGSALADAASPTQEPSAIAALISVFVIGTIWSRFGNPRADRFGFAIDMTILLRASRDFFVASPSLGGRVMPFNSSLSYVHVSKTHNAEGEGPCGSHARDTPRVQKQQSSTSSIPVSRTEFYLVRWLF
jgi:hypothetical protein